MEPKEIGERLKTAREAKGLSQLEFALLTNVSPSSISRWERGLLPRVSELMRIAEQLDLDPKQLVELAPSQEGQAAALREELAALRGGRGRGRRGDGESAESFKSASSRSSSPTRSRRSSSQACGGALTTESPLLIDGSLNLPRSLYRTQSPERLENDEKPRRSGAEDTSNS